MNMSIPPISRIRSLVRIGLILLFDLICNVLSDSEFELLQPSAPLGRGLEHFSYPLTARLTVRGSTSSFAVPHLVVASRAPVTESEGIDVLLPDIQSPMLRVLLLALLQ